MLIVSVPTAFALNRFNDPNGDGAWDKPPISFYKRCEMNQDCKLFALPINILRQIHSYLFEHHASAAAFARTCQKALNQTAAVSQHWDMSRSNFLRADLPRMDADDAPGKIIVSQSSFIFESDANILSRSYRLSALVN